MSGDRKANGSHGIGIPRSQFLKGLGASGLLAGTGGLITGCGGAGSGSVENYPEEPIVFLVPFGPGSGMDFTSRALAETLQKESLIEVPLQIENRPGGGGAVAISQLVNQFAGDAYTISIQATPLIIETQLRGDSEYGIDDVTPFARIVTEYDMLAVRPDSSYREVQNLIDDLSADASSVAVGGTAGSTISYPTFVNTVGGDSAEARYVQYEAGSEIVTAILNGDLDVGVASISEFAGQLESGDLRGLVILGSVPVGGVAEGLPNMASLDYEFPPVENSRFIFGPPDLPQQVVTFWQDLVEEAMDTPSWQATTDRIKWDNTFMKGEELQQFIDEARDATRTALEQTGGLAQ